MEDMVNIPWEEYKELLMIKGRYEELKEHNNKPYFTSGVDWGIKESSSIPIRELNKPIARYAECPSMECKQ